MLAIQVGKARVQFHTTSRALRDAIAARFGNGEQGFCEVLPERRDLKIEMKDGMALVEYEGQIGRIDLARSEVHVTSSLVLADALVRAALAWQLASSGGILLHSSAVRIDGRAYVFFGRSTAGKSTLAHAYGDVIADELSLVETSDGKAFAVHPTPWWHGKGPPAPLAQLVWIVRGEAPSARRIRGGELVRGLSKEAGRYFPVSDFERKVFDLCAEMASSGGLRVAAGEGRVVEDVREALERFKEAA